MSLIETARGRAKTVRELLGYFWRSRWWWLTPMFVFLVLFALFIVSVQGPLAPFIYTLF